MLNILKKDKEIVIDPDQKNMLESYHTKVIGDIVGHDGVYLEGVVDGCVIVDNLVVVANEAEVKGKIQAQKVVVEGEVRGRIECDYLQVEKSGLVLANVEAREIKVKGKLQGEIIAYDLSLEENAFLGTKVQVNRLVINGTVVGDISSDTLLLKEGAYVKGNIYANSFANEGGVIKGAMQNEFKQLLQKRTMLTSSELQNKQILKEAIDRYIKNSEYINDILKQKVDIDIKVKNLINYIKQNEDNQDELVKVTRLINYKG